MDFSKIKAFAFDVDGVMTDGGILCTGVPDLLRTFSAKDCFGIRMAMMNGYKLACITGAASESVKYRCRMCGMKDEDIFLCSRAKIRDFETFCKRYGLDASEVMYFGDDIPDIPVMRAAGIGVCPSDAADDVLKIADMISEYPGGRGCIRHAIEDVMHAQGTWNFDVDCYEKNF